MAAIVDGLEEPCRIHSREMYIDCSEGPKIAAHVIKHHFVMDATGQSRAKANLSCQNALKV
jgi:hypothetical protein